MVSNDGQYPSAHSDDQDQLLAIGPMCRYAHDVTLALKILVDKKADLLRLDEKVDISRIKVSQCNVILQLIVHCPRNPRVTLRARTFATMESKIHNCIVSDLDLLHGGRRRSATNLTRRPGNKSCYEESTKLLRESAQY